MLEQPRDDPVVRRRARDVGEGDAYLLPRLHDFLQRLRADRALQRTNHRRALIGQSRLVQRRDDRRAVLGQFNRQVSLTVGEHDFHGGNVSHKFKLLSATPVRRRTQSAFRNKLRCEPVPVHSPEVCEEGALTSRTRKTTGPRIAGWLHALPKRTIYLDNWVDTFSPSPPSIRPAMQPTNDAPLT